MILLVLVLVCVSGCVSERPPHLSSHPMGVEGAASVLSVVYSGGMLHEVRVEAAAPPMASTPNTPVAYGRRPCADLCRAGLGGKPCGKYCNDLIPDSLSDIAQNLSLKSSFRFDKIKKILKSINNNNNTVANQTNTSFPSYGRPRSGVCPVLCKNNLGQPICGCQASEDLALNWTSVCETFCHHGSYELKGCPACSGDEIMMNSDDIMKHELTQDIWVEWCNHMCKKGDGGAACNCDLAPLSLPVDFAK